MRTTRTVAATILVLCGGVLISCTMGKAAQIAHRAQSEMIGLPKQQLLACAGYPNHHMARDGKEYYTYRRRARGAVSPTASIDSDGARSSSSVALGIELETPLVGGGAGGCVTTIVLSGELVEQVTFPTDGWLSECAPIVQNCLITY